MYPTGRWDSSTIDAMKQFQAAHGLNPWVSLTLSPSRNWGSGPKSQAVARPSHHHLLRRHPRLTTAIWDRIISPLAQTKGVPPSVSNQTLFELATNGLKQLVKTIGTKGEPGADDKHFNRPTSLK